MSKRPSSSVKSGRHPKQAKPIMMDIISDIQVTALKSILAMTWALTHNMFDIRVLYDMYLEMCDALAIDRSLVFGYDPKSRSILKSTIIETFPGKARVSGKTPVQWSMHQLMLPKEFKLVICTIKIMVDTVAEHNAKLQSGSTELDSDNPEVSNCLTILADSFTSHVKYVYDGPHGIPQYLYTICSTYYNYECDSETSEIELTDEDIDIPPPLEQPSDNSDNSDDDGGGGDEDETYD
jgi:hypothetical protein